MSFFFCEIHFEDVCATTRCHEHHLSHPRALPSLAAEPDLLAADEMPPDQLAVDGTGLGYALDAGTKSIRGHAQERPAASRSRPTRHPRAGGVAPGCCASGHRLAVHLRSRWCLTAPLVLHDGRGETGVKRPVAVDGRGRGAPWTASAAAAEAQGATAPQ